jgi:phosphate transport system substrate-binding protein
MGWLALAGVVMLAGAATAAEVAADAELKPYEKVAGVSGTINSVGSDTLNNLMQQWAEGFKKHYPNVAVQIEGKGSATAPPALTEGIAQLGPMSRAMKDTEIEAFEKKHGFKPTRVGVALDCLAVYVHKDNPVRGLTMPQVDCIFSSTRKSGFRDIATWGGVHLTGEWAERPISLYGRDTASGTYGFFKEHALNKGDFKDSVKQQPGSAGVVNGVANDIAGIGYSGIGYKTADVRALPLAKGGDDPLVEPTFENALAGKYPLGRTLYIYVSKKPSEPLPLHIKEFLKFTLSREGQEIVVKDGFGALPLKVVANQLKAVE